MSFFLQVAAETMPAQTVLYQRRTGPYGRENAALMEEMKHWMEKNRLFDGSAVILAVPLDDPAGTTPENCRYDVCTPERSQRDLALGETKRRCLAGGSYAVFQIEHTAEALQRAWEECFAELPLHGFTFDPSRPVMERYAEKLVNRHLCELCVPILCV